MKFPYRVIFITWHGYMTSDNASIQLVQILCSYFDVVIFTELGWKNDAATLFPLATCILPINTSNHAPLLKSIRLYMKHNNLNIQQAFYLTFNSKVPSGTVWYQVFDHNSGIRKKDLPLSILEQIKLIK